jgi:predicted naringenin-chalcone synthase
VYLLLCYFCCHLTGIKPEEIDILVTTSSVFAPTPSVASMLVNMFKMREDVQVRLVQLGLVGSSTCMQQVEAAPGHGVS